MMVQINLIIRQQNSALIQVPFTLCAGMAIAVRPTADMQSSSESTAALDTLNSEPNAVGAYDHVPFASAAAVFTMDTASEVFILHSAQVQALVIYHVIVPQDTMF